MDDEERMAWGAIGFGVGYAVSRFTNKKKPVRNPLEDMWMTVTFPEYTEQVANLQALLSRQGISFDTGYGPNGRDWELDWSLEGATVKQVLQLLNNRKVEYTISNVREVGYYPDGTPMSLDDDYVANPKVRRAAATKNMVWWENFDWYVDSEDASGQPKEDSIYDGVISEIFIHQNVREHSQICEIEIMRSDRRQSLAIEWNLAEDKIIKEQERAGWSAPGRAAPLSSDFKDAAVEIKDSINSDNLLDLLVEIDYPVLLEYARNPKVRRAAPSRQWFENFNWTEWGFELNGKPKNPEGSQIISIAFGANYMDDEAYDEEMVEYIQIRGYHDAFINLVMDDDGEYEEVYDEKGTQTRKEYDAFRQEANSIIAKISSNDQEIIKETMLE